MFSTLFLFYIEGFTIQPEVLHLIPKVLKVCDEADDEQNWEDQKGNENVSGV